MPDNRNRPAAMLWFVMAFAVVPGVFRAVALAAVGIPSFTVAGHATWAAYAVGLCAGTLQDLAVGVLALAVVLAARRIGRRGAAAAVGASLFVAAHLYYLLDFLLFQSRRIRMSATFLEFLKFPQPFFGSARRAGLDLLVLGSVLIIVAGVVAWRVIRGKAGVEGPGRVGMVAGVVFVVGVAGATELLPRTVHYAASNIVFRDVLNGLFDREAAWLGEPDVDAVAEYLTPAAEVFDRVDPDYPLLKRTTGFTGPTHFDLQAGGGPRPHVLLLFMESFRARDVGVLGAPHRPSASPHFDRLVGEGVLFTEFYANGVQTTRAVVAALFGVYPRFSRRALQSDVVDYPLIGLPDLMAGRGYRTAFFHNGSLSFERKEDFFPVHGFGEVYGEHDVARRHPGAPRTSWGVHDTYLMDDLVDWIGAREREGVPGFITAFTVSNHHPWSPPDDFQAPDFGVDPADEYHDYLTSFAYSDYALGHLVDLLRRRGLAGRVVLVVLADTGQPMGERDENYMAGRHLYEENVRIPLLIWAPGRLEGGVRVEEVGSQVDLLPTVMDMLGITGVNHAVGTSLRRVVPGRVAVFNNPFHLRFWGARAGRYKYVVSQAAEGEALYDLAVDPGELHNVAAAHPGVVGRLRERVSGVANAMAALYAERRIAPAGR